VKAYWLQQFWGDRGERKGRGRERDRIIHRS